MISISIDYEKLRQEIFEYLDSVSDEELLQELIECGLTIEGEENGNLCSE